MSKKAIQIAILTLAVFQASSAFADVKITLSPTLLRNGPSPYNTELVTLPAGTYVDVVGCTDWCKVTYRGVEGWTLPSLLGNVEVRDEIYEPVQYGWYVLPALGTVVAVFASEGRYYYEERGRRYFVNHSHVHRRHPFRHRTDHNDRYYEQRHWR